MKNQYICPSTPDAYPKKPLHLRSIKKNEEMMISSDSKAQSTANKKLLVLFCFNLHIIQYNVNI